MLLAAAAGHEEAVEILTTMLVQKEADLKELVDKDGCSAVHHAAHQGHAAVINVLATKGFDLDAVDADGMSACMYACSEKKVAAARILVQLGCDITLVNKDGKTAQASP